MCFVSISATGRFRIEVPAKPCLRSRYTRPTKFLVRGDPETGTRQNLNLLLGVVGGKVNIGRGLLVNAGVLFPLTNSGLQPKVTPYFSFEYVF